MPASEDHINYTAADLQRYHAGLMTDPEMHALEKAALEDPFLAEALEGYQHHVPAEGEIEALRMQIAGKQPTKKRAFPLLSKNFLYKAAAILLVGVGIVYLGSLLREKPDKEIVLADQSLNKNSIDSVRSSAQNVEQNHSSSGETSKNQPKVPRTSPSVPPKQTSGGLDDKIATDESKIYEKDIASASNNPASARQSISIDNDKFVIEGKVVDHEGKPLNAAEIQVADQKPPITTDAKGNFAIVSPDSVLSAEVVVSGYERVSKRLKKDSPQTIVMEQIQAPAIDANALKKEKAARIPQPRKNPVLELIEGSSPKEGKENYERFLKNSLVAKAFPDSLQQPAEILLSFSVNEEGHAEQVQVEKPLCKSCDEEVVRLLYSGPVWNNSDRRSFILLKF